MTIKKAKQPYDDSLVPWDEIKDDFKHGILIGNGASRAVHPDFEYDALYDTAMSLPESIRLNDRDELIFENLGPKPTTNFESVLNALWTAKLVGEAYKQDVRWITDPYEHIKNALIHAVRRVHIEKAALTDVRRQLIRKHLRHYRRVYSTNYDLLLYWSIMIDNGRGFEDFFRYRKFDPVKGRQSTNTTRIFYLHGALHLERDVSSDQTTKRQYRPFRSLLDSFGDSIDEGRIPLFVSEGTAQEKMSAIRSSDYLSFAYEEFASFHEPLVIFGHSLSQVDQHLLNAINSWEERPVAVAIRPSSDVVAWKIEFKKRIGTDSLVFLNAETHPLSETMLRAGGQV